MEVNKVEDWTLNTVAAKLIYIYIYIYIVLTTIINKTE